MSPLARRRPLLRAAAVGGGAYALGRRRAEAQAQEDEQEARLAGLESQTGAAAAAPAAPPAGGVSSAAIERLKELGQLRDQGVLTDDEFNREKAKVLGG